MMKCAHCNTHIDNDELKCPECQQVFCENCWDDNACKPCRNKARVEFARTAIESQSRYSDDDFEAGIGDLVADLLHLAQAEGLDLYDIIETAKMHYEAEKTPARKWQSLHKDDQANE